ncbi:hypothetical protein, partial [Klebsiella aerogenes]|uniref:hypothetical protein n=1 Tax=Klebsiella aerogenes TaxID=548 RepID=UPI0021E171EA
MIGAYGDLRLARPAVIRAIDEHDGVMEGDALIPEGLPYEIGIHRQQALDAIGAIRRIEVGVHPHATDAAACGRFVCAR